MSVRGQQPPLEHLRKAPRAGGRPATAVARLGRSPLRRASLFRQIVKHPGDDYRTFLSFDSSEAKPQRRDELSLGQGRPGALPLERRVEATVEAGVSRGFTTRVRFPPPPLSPLIAPFPGLLWNVYESSPARVVERQ